MVTLDDFHVRVTSATLPTGPPPHGPFPRSRSLAAACAVLAVALTLVANSAWQPAASCCTRQTGPGEQSVAQSSEAIDRCGAAEEAITLLRRFLGTNPKPDLLDDTYLLLGAALYRAQQYGEALKYLQQLQAFPLPKWPTVES